MCECRRFSGPTFSLAPPEGKERRCSPCRLAIWSGKTRLSRKSSTRSPRSLGPPVCSLVRGTEDQDSVAVLLDFDTKDAATVFMEKLRSQVWNKPEVIGQLMMAAPTARILEEVAREEQGAG